MTRPPNDKRPGSGGRRGGEQGRRHHTPWQDDWCLRHRTAWGWSPGRDAVANDESRRAPIKLFGKLAPSEQIRRMVRQRVRRKLRSDSIAEMNRLCKQGDLLSAFQLGLLLEEDFAQTCREANR